MKKIAIIVVCLFSLSTVCFADDIYIAQSSAGANNGVDCADAYAVTFFNTSSNWANPKISGKIGPGDTVHLCGTLTTQMATQASGLASSAITILFESGAMFSAPTWTANTGAITIQNNYITLDGGTNGIVQATSNGTTATFGGTMNYSNNIYGVYITSASNVIVQNLKVQTIYNRLAESTDCINVGSAIQVDGSSSNITINNNKLSDARLIVEDILTNTSNITVSNNTIVNGGVNVNIAPGNSSSAGSNVYIYGNTITGGSKWDGLFDSNCQINGCNSSCLTDNHVHQDGIHIFSQGAGAGVSNVNIYDNYLQDFGTHSTSHIFTEDKYITNISIYNNICVNTGVNYESCGMICAGANSGERIFNNTLVGAGSSNNIGISLGQLTSTATLNTVMENNIIEDVAYFVSYYAGSTWTAADYNDYYNGNGSPFYNGSFLSWSQWQGFGYDAHGQQSNPNLNSNYMPQSSSPVRGAGANLTSLGITSLNSDYAGNPRPSSGAWDIGAYQWLGLRPSPPTMY